MKRRQFITAIAAALTATAHATTAKASTHAATTAPRFEPSPPMPDFNNPDTKNAILWQFEGAKGYIETTTNPFTGEITHHFRNPYKPNISEKVQIIR